MTTKNQAIKLGEEDYLKYLLNILKDANKSPDQKEMARKEILRIIK